MRREKLLLLTSILVLLWPSVSSHEADINAASSSPIFIFYVDNSGSPACANTPSNGTEANPWCTINYGISQISSGATLYVKAGTYNEAVLIDRASGTAGNPTVIQAFPGDSVTILGNGVDGGRVKIAGVSYVTFDSFIITNFNQGLFIENSHHIVVQNSTVHDVGQEGLHVRLNSSFVVIQDSTVRNTRKWQFNGEGMYIGTGSAGPLDNTNNIIIRNNVIHDTIDEGIELKPGTHDCLVEGNTLFNISSGGATTGSIEVNQAVAGVQHWDSNPNHVIRNNIIHSSSTAIRAGTGVSVYNNLIYSLTSGQRGIYVDNLSSDGYTRIIYHNTIDLASANAVVVAGGTADVKNNIGPTGSGNIFTADSYYVDKAGADYHLAVGSAPVNAGLDLTAVVPTDIEGKSRLASPPPDLGAYERVSVARPAPPTNLRVAP